MRNVTFLIAYGDKTWDTRNFEVPDVVTTPRAAEEWVRDNRRCDLPGNAVFLSVYSWPFIDNQPTWVIQHPDTGLYWSRECGWGSLLGCNRFTDEQRMSIAVPVNGRWVMESAEAFVGVEQPQATMCNQHYH